MAPDEGYLLDNQQTQAGTRARLALLGGRRRWAQRPGHVRDQVE